MSGFLSGSTALTVYKVDTPDAITAAKLKQYAFQPIDDIPEPIRYGMEFIRTGERLFCLLRVPDR